MRYLGNNMQLSRIHAEVVIFFKSNEWKRFLFQKLLIIFFLILSWVLLCFSFKVFFWLDAVQNVHIYLKISRLVRKSPALHHWSNTLFPAKIVRFIIEFGSSPRKFCVYSRKVWLFLKSASKMRIQSQLLSPLCITLMYNSFFCVKLFSDFTPCWNLCKIEIRSSILINIVKFYS